MRTRSLLCGVLTLALLWVGVAQAHNTPEEEANIKLVRDFYGALEAPRVEGAARGNTTEKYVSPDYIQHSTVNAGVPGAQRRGGGAPPSGGAAPGGGAPPSGAPGQGAGRPRMGPTTLLAIAATGDKVIQVTSRTITDSTGKVNDTIIFNMFRVKDGKLVEHWDAFSPEPK